ncbi:hypothetical protein [Morganella morganii]|uniref:hypothetical protein n=1 Tax=Morganella morganii TaxID=582 RepID=UPI001BDAFFC2|nr:hypothetical protein [Morganella morganii]MBT0420854.1 hypothetical protein [Morganella morganii subsp. morganii]MBT0515692.1 hypothetical protein [Morganella morganii subsp. morganii]QWM05244.1 hypothetical protein IZ185_05825 [Morganella morganii subsp. morganii]
MQITCRKFEIGVGIDGAVITTHGRVFINGLDSEAIGNSDADIQELVGTELQRMDEQSVVETLRKAGFDMDVVAQLAGRNAA